MSMIHGFQLKQEKEIKEIKTEAKLYRHERTGAELLSLRNDDENKVFGITFRTPPGDSTGVAHILEHSVLCGSRKYPVKEPFVELLKGSLRTFLNAMTYPDKTTYPVASQNIQDFYNLIDVYLDAVFYPRLTPFIFQQEGWHLELEDSDQPLAYKGVVFSEMKGAYSSPDNLLSEYSVQSIFPDNAYGFDSGGNPKRIPSLTYDQFQAFHKKYYHPSNAHLYFYGDDDPNERLKLMDTYLKHFDHMEIDSAVRLQPPFHRPKRVARSFMVGEEEKSGGKGFVTLNWLLPETSEVEMNFSFRMLEYVLLGMPASPLRKNLIDSGLGEDLAGEGLGTELRQMYFSTGLRGVDMEKANQVENLILGTLQGLARKGIDPLTVEAALNTIEFRLRENNAGGFPRGLALMLRSLSTWLHGNDPLSLIAFEAPLEAVKSKVEKHNRFFEDMIRRLFVRNAHRTTLVLEPDPGLREKEEASEKARLNKVKSELSTEKLEYLVENTCKLKKIQEAPDPPEALATIPMLKLADLDKKNKTIPLAPISYGRTTILFHDLFTSGIAYLDIGFNLHALPDRFLLYVPLFGRALVEMGTDKESFVVFTQRVSRKTGGISPHLFTSSTKQRGKSVAWLFLRGKCMVNQSAEMARILSDVLQGVRLDDRQRFKQMALEEKARWEQHLIPSGHRVVNLRLRSHFDEAHWAAEQMEGISYLFFLKKLVKAVDEDWYSVVSVLQEIRRILVNRNAMILNITLDERNRSELEKHVLRLLDMLPEEPYEETDWSSDSPVLCEGMTIPTQVNYVGKAANLYDYGYRFHGSSLAITRYLRVGWLWERVRVRGGAYGAFCLFDRFSGILTFVSYRDPNLMETLEAFDQAAQVLREIDLSEDELAKAIIGAIGDLDAHMLPDAKGYTSMLRYLTGDSEEERQRMRDEVLGTKSSDFRAFGQVLENVVPGGVVKVLGSPSALKAISSDRPKRLKVFSVL